MLVVVCGLPGAGKTTVAETIADRLDATLLRTDVVRKDILPDPDYTEEETRMVYGELFQRGHDEIERGGSVVFDGTFKSGTFRRRAQSLADALDVTFRMVKVECTEDVVRERIAAREDDASDADFEIHTMFREQFEPIAMEHVTVDNSDGLDRTQRQVRAYF